MNAPFTNLPHYAMHDRAVQVCMVLGVDYTKVAADSLTLEPFGADTWIVRWQGTAILSGEAAAGLFGDVS